MNSPIVLAYSGTLAASAAIAWLAETSGADIVTLTLDVGQEQSVEPLRARALACGARRAHVIDVRDEFARECVVPAMRGGAPLAGLVRPIVVRRLIDVAGIEGADAVAHASGDAAFHRSLAAANPSLRVLAPARDPAMEAAGLEAYARRRRLPYVPPGWSGGNVLVRPVCDPAAAPEGAARMELSFRDYVPSALNGVDMTAAELLESLALIAGQYGIGRESSAPAVPVLRAAYSAVQGPDGAVTLTVSRGSFAVLASTPPLVTVA